MEHRQRPFFLNIPVKHNAKKNRQEEKNQHIPGVGYDMGEIFISIEAVTEVADDHVQRHNDEMNDCKQDTDETEAPHIVPVDGHIKE